MLLHPTSLTDTMAESFGASINKKTPLLPLRAVVDTILNAHLCA